MLDYRYSNIDNNKYDKDITLRHTYMVAAQDAWCGLMVARHEVILHIALRNSQLAPGSGAFYYTIPAQRALHE